MMFHPEPMRQLEGGTPLQEDIRALLGEALVDHASREELLEALVQSRKQAQNASQLAAKPFQNLSPEEMTQAFRLMGCPEKAEDYRFTASITLPEAMGWDPEGEARFQNLAHQAGLTAEQYQMLLDGYVQHCVADYEQAHEQRRLQAQDIDGAVQKAFGPHMRQMSEAADHAIHALGGEPLAQALRQVLPGMGPEAATALVKNLAHYGQSLSESRFVGGDHPSWASPETARKDWAKKQQDSGFVAMLRDKHHPGHDAAVAEQTRLFRAMYPG